MKRTPLALSLSLLAVAALQMSTAVAQTTAAAHISQGRAALSKQTPDGIAEALTTFDAAVTAEPGNAEANFFKAAALLLQEAGSAEFRKQFSDIGVNISPDIYKFSLLDAYTPGHRGIFLPSGNATTDAHLSYLNSKETLLAEVLKHLEKITNSNFKVTLSATETALLQTQVDYADVCLLRAGVHLAKAAIALGNSYNVTAQYKKLYDLFEDEKLNPEIVMKEFPLLLTFSPTPERRLSAKTSFKAAYSEWAKAYPLLKARSFEDSSGALFGFESAAYVQELNDVYFSVMNTALDSAATLSLIDPFGYFPEEPKLNLSSLFSTSQAPRFYFPTVFDRGYFRPNAWSDPTFGGILPQGTQSYATDLGVASWLVQNSVYEPYEFRVLVGDPIKWGYYDEDQKTPLFRYISSIALDDDGNLYVADGENHVIRKITTDDTIYTVVGTKWSSGNELSKLYQYSGSSGYQLPPGVLQWIESIAVSKDGTIFFDNENQIWKQTPSGVLSVVAGNPSIWSAQDGIGAEAGFSDISAMTVGPDGDLYLCDGNAIRKVEANGRVTTIAGELGSDSKGGYTNGSVAEARFNDPNGIAVAADGTIFVSEQHNGCIRRISKNGIVDTYVGYGPLGALGGWFYMDAQGSNARCQPAHLAIDNEGNLYFEEAGTIRKVNKDRVVRTIGGYWGESDLREGVGEGARIPSYGNGIAVDRRGTLYVAYDNFVLTAESIVNPNTGDSFPATSPLPQTSAKPEVQSPQQSAPQLFSLTLETKTVDLSDGAVELPFWTTNNESMKNLNFSFHSESGAYAFGGYTYGMNYRSYGKIRIGEYTKSGNYTVNWLDFDGRDSFSEEEIQSLAGNDLFINVTGGKVDNDPPVIHGFEFLTAGVNADNSEAKVYYQIQVSDELSGPNWLSISFEGPTFLQSSLSLDSWGNENLVSVNGDIRTYQGFVRIPAGTSPGQWIVHSIYIDDNATNQESSFGDSLPEALKNKSFSGGPQFSNSLDKNDLYHPWIVDVELDSTSVDVSEQDQKVKVRIRVNNDNPTLGSSMHANFDRIANNGEPLSQLSSYDYQLVAGTSGNGVYETEMIVPKYSRSGDYALSYLDVNSADGKQFRRTIDNIPEELKRTLTVVSKTPDITAPQLQGISLSGGLVDTRNGTTTITANLTIVDEQLGFYEDEWTKGGAIGFTSPSGKEYAWAEIYAANRISGNSNNGTYQVWFQLPQYSEEGIWTLDYVELRDANYNTRYLIPANLEAMGIEVPSFEVQGHPRGWEQQSFTQAKSTKGNATIQLSNLTQTADGTEKVPSVLTTPSNLTQNVTLTFNGVTTPPVEAGNYTVVAYLNDPNYRGREVATLTITDGGASSGGGGASSGGGGASSGGGGASSGGGGASSGGNGASSGGNGASSGGNGASSGGGGAAPAAENSKKGGKKSGGAAKKSSDSSKKSGGDSKKSSAKKSGGGSKKSSAKKSSGGSKGGKSKKSGGKKK